MRMWVCAVRIRIVAVLASVLAVAAESQDAAKAPPATPPAAGRLAVREADIGGWTGSVALQDPEVSRDCAHFAARVERNRKQSVIADGQEGKAYDRIDELTLSPDGKRVAYIAWRGEQKVVVLDGQEGKEYRQIAAGRDCKPTFSPDGRHLAYAAHNGRNWLAVLDGQEGKEYDEVAHLTFSRDGKRLAYRAQKGESWLMVVDGQEGKGYRFVFEPAFDAQGRHLAYAATAPPNGFVVVDGQEGKAYDRVECVRFAPAGERLAYIAKRERRQLVVADGREGKSYDEVRYLWFSPDGQHLACHATRGEKELLVLDGREGREYDEIRDVVFSPDGRRVAYRAGKGMRLEPADYGMVAVFDHWVAVVDGQESKDFDEVCSPWIVFSPDGRRVAYLARRRGVGAFAVVDGQEGPAHEGVEGVPVFSRDGRRLAYLARKSPKDGGRPRWAAVVDGAEGQDYEEIEERGPLAPAFSPDGKHFAFAAAKGEKWVVVVDGRESPEYDSLLTPTEDLFAGPGRVRFAAARGSRILIVESAELPPPEPVQPRPLPP